MGLDIRWPIGGMFSVIGLLLTGYGLGTRGAAMYREHSLGLNVNLGWGLVMLAFGVAMLALSWRAHGLAKLSPPEAQAPPDPPRNGAGKH
jgi:hypothetical protein